MVRVGKKLLLAAMIALGGLASQAKAGTVEIATYVDTPQFSWHYTNGTLSASTTGVFDGAAQVPQIINYTGAVTTTVSATPGASATTGAGFVSQAMNGSIIFKSGSTLILEIDFVGALISGQIGSRSDNLGADELTGQIISYSASNTVKTGTFNVPSSFTISLGLFQDTGLTLNGSNLSNFDATAAGTFYTGQPSGDIPGTPSPESVWGGLSLMGLIGGTSMWVRRRRL